MTPSVRFDFKFSLTTSPSHSYSSQNFQFLQSLYHGQLWKNVVVRLVVPADRHPMCSATRLPDPTRIRYRKSPSLHSLVAPAIQQRGFEVQGDNLPAHHPCMARKFLGLCEPSREDVVRFS